MAVSNGSAGSRQSGEVRSLEEDVERYRRASEDALQQLDWCIGYLHGCGKQAIARALASNRSHIRRHLLHHSEQQVPSEKVPMSEG